jgi:hypothetical protein
MKHRREPIKLYFHEGNYPAQVNPVLNLRHIQHIYFYLYAFFLSKKHTSALAQKGEENREHGNLAGEIIVI